MELDPRRILIFRTVARAGSVSAGARSLGWTQPAVSQHIRTLENEIGTALLLRSAAGVCLTEAGERLLHFADAIAASLANAKADLAELADGGGTVRLAAFPSAMADTVPRAIAQLSERAPGVRVRVAEAEPPEAAKSVIANEVDIAVVFSYSETPDDAGLERVALGVDPQLAIVPAGHPLAGRTSIRIGELATDTWVAGCPRCRTHLETLAAKAGFVPRIDHSTDDFVAAQSFVARTNSVTLLPHMAVQALLRDDVAALTLDDDPGRQLFAVYRTGAERVPAIRAMLDALRECVGEDAL